MQNQTASFGFKKFSLYTGSVLVAAALLMCGGELYFGSLDGDLTRLGNLPERDFGWRQPQPLIEATYLQSYPIAEADVLIIGDSFSISLAWQSRLVRGGLKPATVHWDNVKLCSGDFAQVIRQTGFSGRYVVIEAVERTLQGRMLSICGKGSKIAKATKYMRPSPPASRPQFSLESSRLGAKWVIEAMLNRLRYTYLPTGNMTFGTARMLPVENGCERFSNRWCNYSLFYADDFSKAAFTSVNTAQSISRNLADAGMQAIWLPVPDKSTVYLGNGKFNAQPYINPWQSLTEKGMLCITELDRKFTRESGRVKDLYAPNNTHLSPGGYLFLGELMLDYIQKLERAPSSGTQDTR